MSKENVKKKKTWPSASQVGKEKIKKAIKTMYNNELKARYLPYYQKVEKLFNENLDLDFIGRFVLGRYWRTATAEERKEFINVYRELNIKTWSSRFDEFKGKSFIFKGTSPSSSAGQIFVNTEVPMDQGAPAKVVWRVKENKGQFKVVDIIIENVSLAITARNEYTAFIKNSPEGVQGLINNLKSKLQNQ